MNIDKILKIIASLVVSYVMSALFAALMRQINQRLG